MNNAKIYASYSNILIVDSENMLWIMGDNQYRKTGVGIRNEHIYAPIQTGITLDDGEEIKTFYAKAHFSVIYTTLNNLYISNYLKKKNSKRVVRSMNRSRPRSQTNSSESSEEIASDSDDESEDNGSSSGMNMSWTPLGFQAQQIQFDPNAEISFYGTTVLPNNDIGTNIANLLMQRIFSPASHTPDVDRTVVNNRDFLSTLVMNNRQYDNWVVDEGGFSLLSDHVDNMMVMYNTILFEKDGQLYVFDLELGIDQTIINKKIGLSMNLVTDGECPYYKLLFPFTIEKINFSKKFVHFYVAGFHHVIFVSDGGDKKNVTWIYFRSDHKINHNNIYTNVGGSSIYVNVKNTIYEYSHKIHNLVPILSDLNQIYMLNCNNEIDTIICTMKSDGLWIFDGVHYSKVSENNELLYDFMDINVDHGSNLILIKRDGVPRINIMDKSLYINLYDITYYKLFNSGIIYYDVNTLYYCTTEILAEDVFDTIEVDKYNVGGTTYYLYIFSNIPENITHIMFTDRLIIIHADDKYYYHVIHDEDAVFSVDKFTEINIGIITDYNDMVLKTQVIRQKKRFASSADLSIGTESNKFKKLLNIMELLRNTQDFTIQYVNKNEVISYGDGPKRDFLESAISQFADKYLIFNTASCVYNPDTITKFTEDELVCVGYMLHAVICHSMDNLPFRLPLILLLAIKNKVITRDELEYFVYKESPDIFKNILKYQDDPEGFASLDSGYDSYLNLLLQKSGIPAETDIHTQMTNISKNIALGFIAYAEIKNLASMNYPTLDYYISGDYIVDRQSLIKNIEIQDKYRKTIVDIINSLSEDKLAILLRNWSGTSIVKKKCVYTISITKEIHDDNKYNPADVNFATCPIIMNISKKIISNPEMREVFIELLTTPVDSMLDP